MNEPEVIPLASLARVPAERAASAVPWAAVTVWTAAEIMHWAAWPGMSVEAALGAVAAFGITFGAAAHRGWGWRAPVIAAAFAAWLALACARGPLDGFHVPPLTIVWAVLTMAAWRIALSHPSITEARRWRQKRAGWLAVRHDWHLPGSHLLEHTETWLGERFIVDVSQTGKLASAIARSDLPERIATRRKLPRTRVRVSEHHVAGEIVIDIRDRDPWAKPVTHPLLGGDLQRGLSAADAAKITAIRDGDRCTIGDPVAVGQDPATGRVASIPFWDEAGGKNISVVGQKGAGKTVLLNCISEGVTRAADALMIRINVSIKGAAESAAWGPACHLTAFGPQQKARALKVLRVASGVIEWRAQEQARTGTRYSPSERDPLVVVLLDEIDAAMEVAALRRELENISSKGRELGVSVARAGQRGTAEWTGGANVRSQDDVFCLGKVNRSTEAMHAAGDLGLRLPDMATYGEGKPGVWVIAELGDPAYQSLRAWNLDLPADIAAIAAERANLQPDLPAACKEFLGDEYAVLLGTDVYARWARDHAGEDAGDDAGRDFMASRPRSAPLNPGDRPGMSPAVTIDDPTERLDYPMDEDMKAKFAAIDEKLSRAKRTLAETAAMPKPPEVPEDKLKESSEARWAMLAEDTVIPPETRTRLLDLLAGDGMSGRKITEALTAENPGSPPKRAWVMAWLNRLRWEEAAYVDGKGAGARWRLTAEQGDGS